MGYFVKINATGSAYFTHQTLCKLCGCFSHNLRAYNRKYCRSCCKDHYCKNCKLVSAYICKQLAERSFKIFCFLAAYHASHRAVSAHGAAPALGHFKFLSFITHDLSPPSSHFYPDVFHLLNSEMQAPFQKAETEQSADKLHSLSSVPREFQFLQHCRHPAR